MSMFLNPYSMQEVNQAKLDLAEVDFDAMATTFNTMMSACREKCISNHKYDEGELSKGEMMCTDRCIKKAFFANRMIGMFVQTRDFTPERMLSHYKQVSRDIGT